MKRNLPILIIVLVGVAAIIGAVVYFQSNKATQAVTQANLKANANAATNKIKEASPGAQPAWAKGLPSAPVKLEEFADFQCPSCATFDPTLREIKTVYGDRVQVVFRQFPLPMHPKAEDASRATEAAGMQGADKFWAMHDMIYDKQKDWSVMLDHRKVFSDYAKTLGLDVDKFNNDMVGQVVAQRIAADKLRGTQIGIRATPSVFLNGRLLTPPEMTASGMRQAIDQALQNKPAASDANNGGAAAPASSPSAPATDSKGGSNVNAPSKKP